MGLIKVSDEKTVDWLKKIINDPHLDFHLSIEGCKRTADANIEFVTELRGVRKDHVMPYHYLDLKSSPVFGFGANQLFIDDVGLIIDKVIFNDQATIVYWKDGTKTVVKCDENEEFDPEKGLAMAIAKKALGNKGNYYNEFKKWLPEPDPEYEEFCKFEEGVRRTNPTWSDSLKALSDAINKANIPKKLTDALFFGGKYRKCNTCEYQAAAFNPCNGCKDGSEYKEVKTNDYLQL